MWSPSGLTILMQNSQSSKLNAKNKDTYLHNAGRTATEGWLWEWYLTLNYYVPPYTTIALKDKKNNISNSLMGETGFLKMLKRFFLVYFPPSKY